MKGHDPQRRASLRRPGISPLPLGEDASGAKQVRASAPLHLFEDYSVDETEGAHAPQADLAHGGGGEQLLWWGKLVEGTVEVDVLVAVAGKRAHDRKHHRRAGSMQHRRILVARAAQAHHTKTTSGSKNPGGLGHCVLH